VAEPDGIQSAVTLHRLKEQSPLNFASITSDTTNQQAAWQSADDFITDVWPYALRAADELGVDADVILAQSALETGWGKAVTRHADGSSSYNLFNIKADKRWDGENVIKSTLEYDNGHAKYEKASFRAYDSYAASFDDYVDFLKSNSRYGFALHNQDNDHLFIKNLHKAGYATDPNYADKVIDIMKRETIQEHAKDKNDE